MAKLRLQDPELHMLNSSQLVITHIDGIYSGYRYEYELPSIEHRYMLEARSRRSYDTAVGKSPAFAYVYAYYTFDENGDIEDAHFYSGRPKTEQEYLSLQDISNVMIKSVFSR